MNKLLFLSFYFLLFTIGGYSQALQNNPRQTPGVIEYSWHLVVWHKDGSKVLFSLDKTPTICYAGDKVIIKSSSTIEYDFQSIQKMTYSLEDVQGIQIISMKEEIPFSHSDGVITFLPTEKDLHVRIIKINGMVVKDFIVRKDEASSIPLKSSLDDLYLIYINGVTYKIKMR